MKLFEGTKSYAGRMAIKKKVSATKRELAVCNLKDAKKVGILFNATHMVSFEIIKDFVKQISTKENKISVLGYVHSKKLIDHYLYRKGFDFFTRNELNWFYKPTSESVQEFIKTPFDLLINLNLEEYYPIKYILAVSKARFKVGKYSEGQAFLDFMIDIEKEKETMENLKKEIEANSQKNGRNKELESIADEKARTEIQLNFLINQLVHYLSVIKK